MSVKTLILKHTGQVAGHNQPFSNLQAMCQFCFLKLHPASPGPEQRQPQLCLLYLAFLHQSSSPEHRREDGTWGPVWAGFLQDQESAETEDQESAETEIKNQQRLKSVLIDP